MKPHTKYVKALDIQKNDRVSLGGEIRTITNVKMLVAQGRIELSWKDGQQTLMADSLVARVTGDDWLQQYAMN